MVYYSIRFSSSCGSSGALLGSSTVTGWYPRLLALPFHWLTKSAVSSKSSIMDYPVHAQCRKTWKCEKDTIDVDQSLHEAVMARPSSVDVGVDVDRGPAAF